MSPSASWPRQSGSQPGNAGSNPAGDARNRFSRFHWDCKASQRAGLNRKETGPDRRFRRGNVRQYVEHRKRRDGPVSEASEPRSTPCLGGSEHRSTKPGDSVQLGAGRPRAPAGDAHQSRSIGVGCAAASTARCKRDRLWLSGSTPHDPTDIHASVLVAPGASLRSLPFRVRLPAEAPQGGTAPNEAHNLAPAGSTPAPATAATPGEGRLP